MERIDIKKHGPLLIIPLIIALVSIALVASIVARPASAPLSEPTPALPDSVPVTTEVDQTGYRASTSPSALGDADFQAHVKNLLETTELNAVVKTSKGTALSVLPRPVFRSPGDRRSKSATVQDPKSS
jgi:hypothetical protein